MVSKQLLRTLRDKRNKLRKLAAKQNKIIMQRRRSEAEELRLKREIRKLGLQTSKSFTAKIRRAYKNPRTREKLVRAKKIARRGFKKLQDFADRMPE